MMLTYGGEMKARSLIVVVVVQAHQPQTTNVNVESGGEFNFNL